MILGLGISAHILDACYVLETQRSQFGCGMVDEDDVDRPRALLFLIILKRSVLYIYRRAYQA
jgi:hypothetical protein